MIVDVRQSGIESDGYQNALFSISYNKKSLKIYG